MNINNNYNEREKKIKNEIEIIHYLCVCKKWKKFKCVNGIQHPTTDAYCEQVADICLRRLFSFNFNIIHISFGWTHRLSCSLSSATNNEGMLHPMAMNASIRVLLTFFHCVEFCVCILFSPIFTILFDFWCRFDYCNTFNVAFIHLQTIWAHVTTEMHRHRAMALRIEE